MEGDLWKETDLLAHNVNIMVSFFNRNRTMTRSFVL